MQTPDTKLQAPVIAGEAATVGPEGYLLELVDVVVVRPVVLRYALRQRVCTAGSSDKKHMLTVSTGGRQSLIKRMLMTTKRQSLQCAV